MVKTTRIINESIKRGEFPEIWKEAVRTPILKKGDRTTSKLPVSGDQGTGENSM
jgi:hypothetical protein